MTDPDYARLLTKISCIAKVYGYAIGLHGSGTRDLDLLAVPWTEEAASADKLVLTICVECELFNPPDNPRIRPHGRLGWALHLSRQDRRYVDLSVMPLKADAAQPSQDGLPELPQGYSAVPADYYGGIFLEGQMRRYGALCRAAAVPEGFVLVPLKPTEAMVFAGGETLENGTEAYYVGEAKACYAAMLAAAPKGET